MAIYGRLGQSYDLSEQFLSGGNVEHRNARLPSSVFKELMFRINGSCGYYLVHDARAQEACSDVTRRNGRDFQTMLTSLLVHVYPVLADE